MKLRPLSSLPSPPPPAARMLPFYNPTEAGKKFQLWRSSPGHALIIPNSPRGERDKREQQ